MNLTSIFQMALKTVVVPVLDTAVKATPTPFDDLIWAAIRARVIEAAGTSPDIHDVKDLTPDGVLATFKGWVNSLLSTVDGYVAAWHTPFEIDDAIWGVIKGKVQEIVGQVQFTKKADGTFAVAAA